MLVTERADGGYELQVHIADVAEYVRAATDLDLEEMIHEIKGYPLLSGVRGQKPKDTGILKNVLVSREWASILNSRFRRQRFEANGVSRSLSYDRAPLVRMPNLTLRPGNQTLHELIGGIDHGFFIEDPYSWSMAPDRGSYQFGAEIARVIEHGTLGNIVRNPGYAGKTLNFWRSCQGVSDRHSMKAYSIMNCGKGIPAADMRMTNYMVPAAFKNVTLFNRRKFYGGTQC